MSGAKAKAKATATLEMKVIGADGKVKRVIQAPVKVDAPPSPEQQEKPRG